MPDFPGMGTITGRADIVAFWKEAMKHFPGVVFIATPGSIVVEGDEARVVSYAAEVYDQNGVTQRDLGRYDPKMGARPMARLIQEQIKRPLAEELLFGRLVDGGTVRVTADETAEALTLVTRSLREPELIP
jgi:hypothetical protein